MRTNELSSKDELMEALANDFMIDELAQIETAVNAALKLKSCYIAANITPFGRLRCSMKLTSEGNKFDAVIYKAGNEYIINNGNLKEFKSFLRYLRLSRKAAVTGKHIFGDKTWNNCVARAALVF